MSAARPAPVPPSGESSLPRGRIVKVELEVRLPVDATMKDIDDWIGLQFGKSGLSTASPLSDHSPEAFDDVMLTDTGMQGHVVMTNLHRTPDGIAYRIRNVRTPADAPPEPNWKVVRIGTDGTCRAEAVFAHPTVADMTSMLLGDLLWTDIEYEGRPARLFYARPWHGPAAQNRIASELAGNVALAGEAIVVIALGAEKSDAA